jgi:multiple sugar transport system permease protein/raffinose/stachyose/melibiose transport system permease protein
MFEIRTRWGRILLQVVVTLLVLPFLFPLVAMVQGSLAGDGWANYEAVLAVPGLWRFFLNTVVIAAGVIVLVYIVTMLAAYGFGKLRIRGREVYFWMLLACLTLPEVVLLTPLFTTAQAFGFFDTYWAVILPIAALQVPFAVLLARNFVQGIPDELFEAARVDGGSVINGFRHLVIPLTRPIAAAVLIFTLIGAWNNYLFPLVFLQSPEMQTITLVPQFFVGQFSNDQTKILASAVIIAIPEIVAYLCLQRYFERGLAAGAIK